MPVWDSANLSSPHTQRELDEIPNIDRAQVAALGKYGNRNLAKMLAEVNALRQAIRAEGTPAIQDAWDEVEQHIDAGYQGLSQGAKS